jgi:hypothetical protein
MKRYERYDWSVGEMGDREPGDYYKWSAEHPDKGEHYFHTKREAERFANEEVRKELGVNK